MRFDGNLKRRECYCAVLLPRREKRGDTTARHLGIVYYGKGKALK
jgi:hypothetical protein